jgi:coproporphyrinogen III oxidase-like Fe-S oxidoreductase
VMAESFFAIDEALGGLGFDHYEISNYAKPGQESLHNLGYWSGRDYLGLGCGAYGTVTTGDHAVRYRNHATPPRYLDSVARLSARATTSTNDFAPRGDENATLPSRAATLSSSEEVLDGPTRLRERIMLGLRTKRGFDLEGAAAELATDPYPGDRRDVIARLERQGRIQRRGARLCVPRDAWIWVDDTAARLF